MQYVPGYKPQQGGNVPYIPHDQLMIFKHDIHITYGVIKRGLIRDRDKGELQLKGRGH